MPRTTNETIPRQFRLQQETLDDLDALAAWLRRRTGIAHSRTDAIRYAARRTVESEVLTDGEFAPGEIFSKKPKKISKKT